MGDYNGGYEFTDTFTGDMNEVDEDSTNGPMPIHSSSNLLDATNMSSLMHLKLTTSLTTFFNMIGMALISVGILTGIRNMMQKRED